MPHYVRVRFLSIHTQERGLANGSDHKQMSSESILLKVHGIIEDLLGSKLNDDDVFSDHGLVSLAATQLGTELTNIYSVDCTPIMLFSYPTPALLAAAVHDLMQNKTPKVETLEESGHAEVSLGIDGVACHFPGSTTVDEVSNNRYPA